MIYSVAKLAVTFLLVALSYISLSWGEANLSYIALVDNIEYIAMNKINSLEKETEADQEIKTMLNKHGSHPHYLTTIAIYYENIASTYDEKEQKQELYFKSLSYYKEAASVRNNWIPTLTRMISLKVKLGQIDKELFELVKGTSELARYNEEYSREIVYLLLSHWRDLPPEIIEFSLFHLKKIIGQNKFSEIYEYASYSNTSDFLCELSVETHDSQVIRICYPDENGTSKNSIEKLNER